MSDQHAETVAVETVPCIDCGREINALDVCWTPDGDGRCFGCAVERVRWRLEAEGWGSAPMPENERQGAEYVRLGESMAGNVKRLWCGLMAIKPFLDKPYPDDPRWTPWTRFVEWELERLMTDAEAWRKLQIDGLADHSEPETTNND